MTYVGTFLFPSPCVCFDFIHQQHVLCLNFFHPWFRFLNSRWAACGGGSEMSALIETVETVVVLNDVTPDWGGHVRARVDLSLVDQISHGWIKIHKTTRASWALDDQSLVVKGVVSVIKPSWRSPAGSLPPTQTHEEPQWGTAAPQPLTLYHDITLTTHTIRSGAYGPEWRRSLACGLCLTPARCRRPWRGSRAGGETSGWWCRRGEDRQGGPLCLWDKKRPCVGCDSEVREDRAMWVRLRAAWGLTSNKNWRRRMKSYVKRKGPVRGDRREEGKCCQLKVSSVSVMSFKFVTVLCFQTSLNPVESDSGSFRGVNASARSEHSNRTQLQNQK